ncbi:hypothetical protein LP422_03515 [Janibacter limosus]|uniref:Uncharacterized protein n=1 Tax=Janibacter limosus TaxID=53458 RepID=A0AC61U645_9MICO|nr:hypothetical protein [Janibacter limosus]UUZ45306.1 hypothetical protein LP422_03515 [Janibacter limosus]
MSRGPASDHCAHPVRAVGPKAREPGGDQGPRRCRPLAATGHVEDARRQPRPEDDVGQGRVERVTEPVTAQYRSSRPGSEEGADVRLQRLDGRVERGGILEASGHVHERGC